MTPEHIGFQGEMMLLNWSESSSRGRTVTFLLPEDSEEHPFKAFTIKQGKRAGQRFMAALVQIDESEQPVKQEPKLSQIAAALCKDEAFWRYADERCFDTIHDEDSARNFICAGAGITSRRELDSSKPAAHWFREYCLKPFQQYRDNVTTGIV